MAEPRNIRVEAVVLSHREMGEADRLLVLYTREHGKLRAIAKGVRKINSRKAGHVEPFSRVTLMLARGRSLWIVTQAELIEAYLPIQHDLTKMAFASYVIELIDRFSYEEGVNLPLYRLLYRTLERIAAAEHIEMPVRYFDMRLLDIMGFRPELSQCVSCGKKILPEDQFFSPLNGGVQCPGCGKDAASNRFVPMPVLKYMRHFQRSNYKEAMRAPYVAEILAEMEKVIHYYYLFLLERRLNTPGFIHHIQDEAIRQQNSEKDD